MGAMRLLRSAAFLLGRLFHGAAVALVGVLLALGLGAALLGFRLSHGPLDVSWAVRAGLRLAGAGNVQVGSATLAWAGWHGGPKSPIRLTISRLDVTAPDGTPRLTAREGNATLSASSLLTGQLVPQTAELSGLRLHASRDAAGAWHVRLGDTDGAAPSGDRPNDPGPLLKELRKVSLHNASVEVEDAHIGTWQLAAVNADLVRDDDGGLYGEASANAILQGVTAAISARASVQPGGGSQVELNAGPVNPAALAAAVPALASLAPLDTDVTLAGVVVLDAEIRPVSATLSVTAGPGRVDASGIAVALSSATLSARLGWRDGVLARLEDARLEATVPSPSDAAPSHLVVTAEGVRDAGQASGKAALEVDQVGFADLPRLWPIGVAPNARAWLTGNITAGTARNGRVRLEFTAPEDLSDLEVRNVSVGLRAEDLTVWWLRPVPPVEHAFGTLAMSEVDSLEIVLDRTVRTTETTPAGKLTLGGGTIRLTGLTTHDQTAVIGLDIGGTVPATVALLSHPRMRLLSRHAVPFRSSAGDLGARLDLSLPLKKDVDFDDVPIRLDARLTRLRLSGVVANRDLTNGDVRLVVTNDGLDVSGRAAVAGLPGTIAAMLDFRTGPPTQVLQSVKFEARPTVAQLGAAGALVGGMLSGRPVVRIAYSSRRDGAGEVAAVADLSQAGVDVLGWSKRPGPPARVQVHVVLDHDRLRAVDVLRAEGPGLSVNGRAELMPGGRPATLVIDGAEIGRTRLSGRVGFGPVISVSATGPVLDVSTLLDAPGGGGGEDSDAAGMPFTIDMAFGQVLFGGKRALLGVTLHAEHDGRVLRRGSLSTTGPERLVATVVPEGHGRVVNARTADATALLRALDLTGQLEGGAATVIGRFDDTLPEAPFTGRLDIGRLHILGAPALGKILQAVTIYGIADALRGPGLVFSRVEVPFMYANRRVDLQDARVLSSSLGITASGAIDLRRRIADMTGTVVPAYVLNAAPGRIPVIGRLFRVDPGGGLLAATWSVRGALDDPSISVNPFSLLVPGRLRQVFGLQKE